MRKIKFLFLLGLFWMVSLGASAYSFSAKNADGVTIYYNIISSEKLTCSVTFGGTSYKSKLYSGIVNIPASVSYNGKIYSVTRIENAAFYNCIELTSVTIPNSVTSIGENAFYTCFGLTSIIIPNSVTNIGREAFYDCYHVDYLYWGSNINPKCLTKHCKNRLKEVILSDSVTSIRDSAFYHCVSLISIEIPSSVTSIENFAFYYCTSLTSVTIPNSVTSIGDYAFSDCTHLTSVTIGNSVTSIGNRAFYECTSLPIENNIRYADTYLVEVVDKTLSAYTIKEGTKWIGNLAFRDCNSLTSIEIPNSVTSIGDGAFKYCSGLTAVNITDIDKWAEIEFGDAEYTNPLYYAHKLYLNDKLVTEAKLTTATKIGSYAFSGCNGLTSIEIPNSVTNIGDYAFSRCFGLTSVKIGKSVTSIGKRAFYDCSWLKSVTMEAMTPPTCESNAFNNADISNATLTVPIGRVLAYKKVNVWKDFGLITDGEVQFPTMSVTKKETTQTSISFKLNYNKEKCIPFSETGVKWDGSYYKANPEGIVKLDLESNKEVTVYAYAKYEGEYYVLESSTSASTKSLNSKLSVSDIKANKAYIRGVYDIGDAHVYKTTFKVSSNDDDYEIKEQEIKNDKFSLTGLVPNTKYEVVYTIYYHYGEGDKKSGSESKTQNLTTAELKMKTLNPRNVSSTSSVVAAEANISDDETGAGFEWRKYDAPESLPSSKGSAIVYDGRMEGKINNLQTTYYNVRPFYKSASGKVFYGEWITFDPTDFSYFEPTVHTYDMIEDPSSNSVEVRGYVMQGTDDVTEQGFEYWTTGSSSLMKMASNGEVMRVQATGQMMIATLKDLEYESNYVVRAYVVTASGTVYGEERTFTTPADPASGIREVKESERVSSSLKGIYTLDGRKIERITTPGIYIYNGKKIMFKAGQLPVE